PVALRRLHGLDRRLDPLVVLRDLLRPRVVRLEALVDRGGGHTADGELLDALHEVAPADLAVLVLMEDVEEFLGVFGRLFSFHAVLRYLEEIVYRTRTSSTKSALMRWSATMKMSVVTASPLSRFSDTSAGLPKSRSASARVNP